MMFEADEGRSTFEAQKYLATYIQVHVYTMIMKLVANVTVVIAQRYNNYFFFLRLLTMFFFSHFLFFFLFSALVNQDRSVFTME